MPQPTCSVFFFFFLKRCMIHTCRQRGPENRIQCRSSSNKFDDSRFFFNSFLGLFELLFIAFYLIQNGILVTNN